MRVSIGTASREARKLGVTQSLNPGAADAKLAWVVIRFDPTDLRGSALELGVTGGQLDLDHDSLKEHKFLCHRETNPALRNVGDRDPETGV
jgi:hypothetical protein